MNYQACDVSVTVGEKEFVKSYQQVVKASVTVDDILALLQDEKTAKQLINDWHYGADLKAKSEVRNSILNEQAGPEKSIEKLSKDIFKMRAANGKPVTEEKAKELAKAFLELQN